MCSVACSWLLHELRDDVSSEGWDTGQSVEDAACSSHEEGPSVVLAAGSMQEAASPPVQIQSAEPNLIRVIADLPLLPGNGARMVNMKHPAHYSPLRL